MVGLGPLYLLDLVWLPKCFVCIGFTYGATRSPFGDLRGAGRLKVPKAQPQVPKQNPKDPVVHFGSRQEHGQNGFEFLSRRCPQFSRAFLSLKVCLTRKHRITCRTFPKMEGQLQGQQKSLPQGEQELLQAQEAPTLGERDRRQSTPKEVPQTQVDGGQTQQQEQLLL